GSSFAVYSMLTTKATKKALLEAIATNPFQDYESFSSKVLHDDPVNVYLTDLCKLACLASVESHILMLRAFVIGLHDPISRELRVMVNVGSGSLSVIVDRTRPLMSEFVERPVVAVAGGAAQGVAVLPIC
ncbi:hypothetical protein SK128_014267, partial [Halocaridina rubra]